MVLKKVFSTVLAVALFCGIGLTGCVNNSTATTAYEIAVKNGFVGTEAEWLASLKGDKGDNGEDGKDFNLWEIYKECGYEGTFVEFLKELGIEYNLQENNDTTALAKNVSSVVSIFCGYHKKTTVSTGFWGGATKEVTEVFGSGGSGVIWTLEEKETTASAYIITNYHVVHQNPAEHDAPNGFSDCIYVYPYGARVGFTLGDDNGNGYLDNNEQMGDIGDGIKATYVGGAMDYDIAVLKVENSEYLKKAEVNAVKLGSSHNTVLGEKSYVIGNSNGEGISITSGLVSVLSERIYLVSSDGQDRAIEHRVMRTDAAINHGNSGGGLFNAKGELIGIANAKSSSDVENMGYSLPIDRVKGVVDNVLYNATATEPGYVKLARLGITTTLQSATSYLDENGNIRIREEFGVTQVVSNGIAAASTQENKCLKVGDVLLSGTLNGKTVEFEQRYQFSEQLLNVRKGDTITYKVKRGDSIVDVSLTYNKDEYFVTYK